MHINEECSKHMTEDKGKVMILQREEGDNMQLIKKDIFQKELCIESNCNRL